MPSQRPPLSLPPGEVHTEDYSRPADDLLDPQHLPEEDDPRGDPRDGDEVLVDQDLVGPDAVDPRLPGDEGEGRGEERRVADRRPRPKSNAPPLQVQTLRQRQQ